MKTISVKVPGYYRRVGIDIADGKKRVRRWIDGYTKKVKVYLSPKYKISRSYKK